MSQSTRPPAPPGAATIAGLCVLVGAIALGGAPATTGAQPVSQRASAVARATASRPVEVELRSAARVLAPGETAAVAIRLRPEPGWHTYCRPAPVFTAGNTQAMQRDYAKRVVWRSVVSSAPGKQGYTTAEAADELTREKGAAPTAVIRDTTGTLGRLYGAGTTPQYAIIDPQGVLQYSGAIDSRPSSTVKDIATATNYVRAALDAGLAGNPIAVTQTQPYGCDVKYGPI